MAEENVRRTMFDMNTNIVKKLYDLVPNNKGNNLLLSPLSLYLALSMVSEGAEGTTKDQLVKVLGISSNSSAKTNKILMESLKSSENVKLFIGNKIFRVIKEETDIRYVQKFLDTLESCYKSEFETVNIDDKGAVKTINNWISEKTEGLISHVIDDLNNIGLVLINVIYFKSEWARKFETRPKREFYLNSENTIDVDMIYDKNWYKYNRDEEIEAEIVEIPFKNASHRLVVILPFEKDGLKKLEKKLQSHDMEKMLYLMESTRVELYLPKFKIEQTLHLKDPLKRMGLTEMFKEWGANFRGMVHLNSNENCSVDDVVQKCVFEVNEEGCEAAAVTVCKKRISLKKSGPKPPPPSYIIVEVDHPAIFMLVSSYKMQSAVLFYGKLSNPLIK